VNQVVVPKFRIEQVAIAPNNPKLAMEILSDLGLSEWISDRVMARGEVFGEEGVNIANLNFNYQAGNGNDPVGKPLEFEVLDYTSGPNWVDSRQNNDNFGSVVSHLGMHCTAEELEQFKEYFKAKGFAIAQEVYTEMHENPAIKDSRRYHYTIFDTQKVLGVDLKFIVRKEYTPTSHEAV
jgi:hypothetical protein